MTAPELLAELRQRGIEVVAAGDKIRWRPREAVTPELRAALIEHKPALLACLRPPAPPRGPSATFHWPELPALGARTFAALAPCAHCSTATWARYGTAALYLSCARLGADPKTARGLHGALAYREALRAVYRVNAKADATDGEVAAALANHARRLDDLGPRAAEALGRLVAEEWAKVSHRCPFCGTPGEFHRPWEGRS